MFVPPKANVYANVTVVTRNVVMMVAVCLVVLAERDASAKTEDAFASQTAVTSNAELIPSVVCLAELVPKDTNANWAPMARMSA